MSETSISAAVGDALAAPAEQGQEEELQEYPVFEILIPSMLAGVREPMYHFKIYVNGRLEGFEKLGARGAHVTNRLPMMYDNGVLEPMQAFCNDLQAWLNTVKTGIDVIAAGPPPAKDKQS